MDNNANLIFDQLDTSMNQLHKLFEDGVSKLYKKIENFISQQEKETEKKQKDLIENYKSKYDFFEGKIQNVKNKWLNDNFQILLYGKVSTGKSKIINAILGEEIFKSASSHTTSCFVKICKSSDQYHYIKYGNNEEKSSDNLDDLKKKIRDLSTTVFNNNNNLNQLETNELLSVYLNIHDNKILTSNTEIIDCPGSANKESITNYIKEKALNANIFIFVLTGGITENEKSFFQYQLEQSSKPIIFFLVNKWDQANNDGDDVAEESKRQITNGIIDFLINQIKLSEKESEDRIYFVSALDICRKRINRNAQSGNVNNYEKDRCREFEKFEDKLSEFRKSFIKTIYVEDLRGVQNEIKSATKEFKIEFKKEFQINIDYSKDLNNFLKTFENCSKRKEINNDINNIATEFKEFKEKCQNMNRYDIESFDNEFNSLIKKNEGTVLKLHIRIGQVIDDQITQYKKNCNIDVIKEKHEIKEMMGKMIELKTITKTGWEKFFNLFTQIFAILRNHFLTNLNRKDDSILKENSEKIKNEIDKLIDGNLNALSNYLKTETSKITKQLEIKIEAYEEFLREIEILLN